MIQKESILFNRPQKSQRITIKKKSKFLQKLLIHSITRYYLGETPSQNKPLIKNTSKQLAFAFYLYLAYT